MITRDSRTALWRRIARERGEHSTIAADHIEVDAAGVRVCVRRDIVVVTDQEGDGVATLQWPLVVGPPTWLAAARLLAALGRGPAHPYRW